MVAKTNAIRICQWEEIRFMRLLKRKDIQNESLLG